MMEAASTSEMSVNFCQTTWCYNPEDSHLRTHCHKNLKSYLVNLYGEATLHYVWRFKALITLMMEAASTSEMSVNFYQTMWCYNPKDSHLQQKSCTVLL
jgi:hypothetical protein